MKGREKVRYEIYDSVKKELPRSKSWAELRENLRRDGVGMEFKYSGSTDQIQGVRFSKDGQVFNGSKVDRSCSYSKIDFVLSQNFREGQAQQFSPNTGQHHCQSQSFSSGLGSIFDPSDNPEGDIDEEQFRQAMQKKKRRGIRR